MARQEDKEVGWLRDSCCSKCTAREWLARWLLWMVYRREAQRGEGYHVVLVDCVIGKQALNEPKVVPPGNLWGDHVPRASSSAVSRL